MSNDNGGQATHTKEGKFAKGHKLASLQKGVPRSKRAFRDLLEFVSMEMRNSGQLKVPDNLPKHLNGIQRETLLQIINYINAGRTYKYFDPEGNEKTHVPTQDDKVLARQCIAMIWNKQFPDVKAMELSGEIDQVHHQSIPDEEFEGVYKDIMKREEIKLNRMKN